MSGPVVAAAGCHIAAGGRYSRWLSLAIVLGFAVLATIYSAVNPILESPDELAHYGYIEHLAHGYGLPVQQVGVRTSYGQEGSQPPLYYLLATGIVRQVDRADGDVQLRLNPFVQSGIVEPGDNVNTLVHSPAEDWPWRGVALAVHLVRLFSVALGTATVVATLAIGRELFGRNSVVGIGAAALVALNPMFLYMSGSINNDNLVTCIASWAVALMVRMQGRRVTWPHTLGLGLLCGLAALAKVSGLALLPLAALAVALAVRTETLRQQTTSASRTSSLWTAALSAWLPRMAAIAALVLGTAGWWYLRNIRLYGEPLGIETMVDIFGRRTAPLTLPVAWSEFKGFCKSYWGIFGSFTVMLRPHWVYGPLEMLSLAGGLGAIKAAIGRDTRAMLQRENNADAFWSSLVLLAVWVVAIHLSLIRWTLMTPASQGRLVFPAIGAISVLTIWGLCSWFRQSLWPAVVVVALALPLALAIVTPWATLQVAYAPQPVLTAADIPASAVPFATSYGGQVELTAFELSRQALAPGEELTLTLYWRPLTEMDEDYTIYMHLFGRDGEMIGSRHSLAGMGTYPTSRWHEGEIVRDVYRLQVSSEAAAPVAARLNVGLYLHETMERLPVRDGLGREVLQPTLGFIKIEGPGERVEPAYPLAYSLGPGVQLVGYDLATMEIHPGDTVPLTLYWETAPLGTDYTVLVHLESPDGTLIGQGDGPPMAGEYPTRYWGEGEFIADTHLLQLDPQAPPGEARIYVGLYSADGQRLPVMAGDTLLGDRALVGSLVIRR